MNADTVTEYDEDEIDDWPSRMGRTPIGPAIHVQFAKEAHLALCAVAEPFGQRRRSAVIRVAIGRLLADQRANLASLVRAREANRATRPAFSSIVNMHLGPELADTLSRVARDLDTNRTELIRIAVDRFLVDLAQLRLAGTPFDLEAAINAEIFNGEANRDLLIRRRQRREAERLGRSLG
ncbi:ribbon-helix-helix protein, CopG family [Rhodococcus hoagii]|nr:ribbon-helix-helix protein, CopG family [Prescottella equi]NKR80601.1 ribbon-helix-helix protein, CopG family [Prescottella equi]NKS99467.1 ribbon-helix-helix protein, CopG family [Prescottella equi]